MKLKVLVHPAGEGGYWAEVPALPGCVSEGDTLDEVVANIREAAEGWIGVADERTPAAPQSQVVEVEIRYHPNDSCTEDYYVIRSLARGRAVIPGGRASEPVSSSSRPSMV